MTSEIILAIVIVAQDLMLFVMERGHARQIEKLTKALIAKSLTELTHAEAEEKVDPKNNTSPVEEYDPITSDTPETFDQMIKEQLKKAQN